MPGVQCSVSLLPTSLFLDVTTPLSTIATSSMQTDVEFPQLDASVSFTFSLLLGVLVVVVLFAVGSEGLAAALLSEGFVVLHISELPGRSTRSSADSFFPVGFGVQAPEKIFNIVLEWDDLAFVFFKPTAPTYVNKRQTWRAAEFALGVADLCCAPREHLRVHDENVGMKFAVQRLVTCASKKIPTPLEASVTSLVGTVFSVPLSSYNSASFALCAVGGDRSKMIRLDGAHVGDLLLHHRPSSEDHHRAHRFLSKSEEVRLTLELPLFFFFKLVAQALVVQAQAAGKSPLSIRLHSLLWCFEW